MKEPRTNEWGQPIGEAVSGWEPRPHPRRETLQGHYSQVRPLDPENDAGPLFEALTEGREDRLWTYLPYGPFSNEAEYRA